MLDRNQSKLHEREASSAKAEGAFLALAAGDALGWPQEMPRNVRRGSGQQCAHTEFKQWTRRSGGRFQPYEEVIQPGHYSDDTQLTLAVARSRTKHGAEWWKALTRVELPLWMLYERGGGGATKRAARAWASCIPPWKSGKRGEVRRYFEAGGNGVAMRILPHALFLAGQDDPSSLTHDVVLDGSATHGHPRALVGAAAYAHAAWSLARKNTTLQFGELLDSLIDEAPQWGAFPKSESSKNSWLEAADSATNGYEAIWVQTVGEMRELLETARNGVQKGALADDHAVLNNLGCFGPAKGAGTRSAAAATYLAARHAAQPAQGILRAAFEKGADTDTLAAMTGGLMGCLAGIDWLPGAWLEVQDADYLRNMARQVALGPEAASQQPVPPTSNTRPILSDLVRNGDGRISLGDSIEAQATPLPDPKPIAKSIRVRAWRLETTDGQTLFVANVEKLQQEKRPPRVTGKRKQRPGAPQLPHAANARSSGTTSDLAIALQDPLYAEFCRQLQSKFEAGEFKRQDIVNAMKIVLSQANKWLEQAEKDGLIKRTSINPAKYALNKGQPSLL